ncbi:unnamed protein product [Rotaria sordida]|uniref:Cyclin C-terminal domain-containing protein n=1 Tax=Rotaria sordida TaxID=392033 RepID=A0A815GFB2_9BILA|nr:unnamed protein product [Rotaria sordida]
MIKYRNYMNDSLRTDIFLRFTPETIACACIDLAARILQIPLPKNPPWYLIFGAQPEEIRYIMIAILRLYNHRPKPLDELEKILNTFREKREDERKKLRPELGCDSPAQQPTIQISIPSTVISFLTPTIVQQEVPSVITTTTDEIINTMAIINGKLTQKLDQGSSRESSTVNNHRHHHRHHHRRKRSSSPSRSSSQSLSRSPIHHPQKKKKISHRSRSRSRSSSRKRHRHQKDKRHHSSHTSNNHRKKDKKRRSRSSSRDDNHYSNNNNKHFLTNNDTNNNIHQRSHHYSFKQINGVSSSSHKNFNLK